MGADVGRAEGAPGAVVGPGVGALLGIMLGPCPTDEGAAVASAVGTADGGIDGMPGPVVGITEDKEGAGVGTYVTSCTPAPATTAVPEHAVAPVQPSWIRYVCAGVPAGTV